MTEREREASRNFDWFSANVEKYPGEITEHCFNSELFGEIKSDTIKGIAMMLALWAVWPQLKGAHK